MKDVVLHNERKLLNEAAAGSQRAFTLLFQHYSGKVYRFALKLTRSEQLAEEAVQDVFMKIWVDRSALTDIISFGAYLNRVNRNHCLDIIRRMARANHASNMFVEDAPEHSLETEQQIDYRNTQQVIAQALAKMTPQQQKVYRLCYIDGLKYEEAAEKLNISAGTVHSHLKQALKIMRTYMRDSGVAFFIIELVHELYRSGK